MFPTLIRRAPNVVRRVANEPIGAYKSPYGPKYNIEPHVMGINGKTVTTFGMKAAGFGGVALFAVIYYASGIPRVQHDILQKVPFIGNYFVNEIPPEDNPF